MLVSETVRCSWCLLINVCVPEDGVCVLHRSRAVFCAANHPARSDTPTRGLVVTRTAGVGCFSGGQAVRHQTPVRAAAETVQRSAVQAAEPRGHPLSAPRAARAQHMEVRQLGPSPLLASNATVEPRLGCTSLAVATSETPYKLYKSIAELMYQSSNGNYLPSSTVRSQFL
jgi:hypothetical protein